MPVGAIVSGPVTGSGYSTEINTHSKLFLVALGYFLKVMGRKWTAIMLAFPMAVGFTCFVIAHTTETEELIYLGRFLTGKIYFLFFSLK